jgi:hypothetical protein
MIRPLRLTALMLLVAAGGCAGKPPATATTRPSELNTTERERTWARMTERPTGYVGAAFTGMAWWFDDTVDWVTGRGGDLGKQLVDVNASVDDRVEAINGLSERPWGQKAPYLAVYGVTAENARNDPLLRATALRALNRAREPKFIPLYIQSLSDTNEWVRMEACKALNRMPDVRAVPDLLKIVARPDESKDVRIAAAEALRHYKRIDAARGLVGLLGERDFSIVWQARESLRSITRRDFGFDAAAWLNYLTKPDQPLS